MDELSRLRAELDQIDRQLAALFEQRMNITRQVGEYKKQRGLPVLDAAREEQVIAKNTALLNDPDLSEDFAELLRTVMAISRRQQKNL